MFGKLVKLWGRQSLRNVLGIKTFKNGGETELSYSVETWPSLKKKKSGVIINVMNQPPLSRKIRLRSEIINSVYYYFLKFLDEQTQLEVQIFL